MLTGTPLDLTPLGEVFRWIGNTIVLLWLALTLWLLVSRVAKRKTRRDKWISAGKVLGVMVGIPTVLIGWRAATVWKERSEFRARYEVAEALFKKRCETAGEFIYKTVPDVKGVVWMKWRISDGLSTKQYDMDDPYGGDCSDESCIQQLLKATEGRALAAQTKIPVGTGEHGFDYVETTDPKDGRSYRYAMRYYRPANRAATGVKWDPNDVRAELHKVGINQLTAQYGITWDDVSTREDRANWIAGGSISVIDLSTSEVIAKRVGYMMDPGLGSRAGFRDPWGFARDNACPAWKEQPGREYHARHRTTDFLFKVLQPTQGEAK